MGESWLAGWLACWANHREQREPNSHNSARLLACWQLERPPSLHLALPPIPSCFWGRQQNQTELNQLAQEFAPLTAFPVDSCWLNSPNPADCLSVCVCAFVCELAERDESDAAAAHWRGRDFLSFLLFLSHKLARFACCCLGICATITGGCLKLVQQKQQRTFCPTLAGAGTEAEAKAGAALAFAVSPLRLVQFSSVQFSLV